LPEEEIAKVARWEAEELLPYPVDDAEIRHLTAGSVIVDGQSRQEVILMACHGGAIRRHIGVLEAAGLQPAAIDVESTAILRGLNAASRRERCAYVALGERATNVIVAEGSQILFLKYVAVGAQQLDQAVARHLGLDTLAAARTRATVNAANELNPDDEIHRGVIDAVRHPLDEMASEIEMCLRYYKVTFRGRAIERVILVGGDASPWLAEYLGQRLDTQYELGNPLASISWPHAARGMSERPWRWTIPLGLAMKPTAPALAAATA
jgi:type IV pilus assembly protein PilM